MSEIYKEKNLQIKNRGEEINHEKVNMEVVEQTNMKLWLPGITLGGTLFLIGMFFDNQIALSFSLGAIFIGFFLATTTTMTSGLLEAAKEWVICKFFVFVDFSASKKFDIKDENEKEW